MTWFNIPSIKFNCQGDAWTESPGEEQSQWFSQMLPHSDGHRPAGHQAGKAEGSTGYDPSWSQHCFYLLSPSAEAAPWVEWLQCCINLPALTSWGETSGHENLLCIIEMMYLSWPGNGCPLSCAIPQGILQEFFRKLGVGINSKGKKYFIITVKKPESGSPQPRWWVFWEALSNHRGFIQKKLIERSKILFLWGISKPLHVPAAQRGWGCPGPCAGVCRQVGRVVERLYLYLHWLRKKWSPGQPGRFQKH